MKQTTVKMPKATLMAIKKMLFNNEQGVDLTSIINDLSAAQTDADLTAINVALVFKGITIDTGENERYGYDYKCYYKRTFKSVSLILDQVVYDYVQYQTKKDGTWEEYGKATSTCSVAEWLDSDTELDLSKVRGL